MNKHKTSYNPQRAAFIKAVVEEAGIKVTKARSPGSDPRSRWEMVGFGFYRVLDNGNGLEHSTRHWGSEQAAYEAAHTHYKLRAS
jgi:hypothetical protein